MGGCASRPKEADNTLPSEAPATPTKAEAETVAQENKGGENQNEAPLVDLSESRQEGEDSSAVSKTADAQPVSSEGQTKPIEDKVEAPAKETEVKVVEEGQDVVATPKAETPNAVAAPSSEDKRDAPLVTV